MITSSCRSGRALAARAVLAAAGSVLALSGCNAGQQAQTAYQQPGVDGAHVQAGGIALRDVKLAYPTTGRYERGSDARLEFVVANDGEAADALVEVRSDAATRVTISTAPAAPASATASATTSATSSATSPSTATVSATSPSASPTPPAPARIPVPVNGLVDFREAGPVVTLVGLSQQLLPAQLVPVTFVFERAGEVTLVVPVGVSLSPVPPPPSIDIGGEG